MTTHSLQPVDNVVHGRLALVTGATLAISFLPVHAPEQKHPDTNLPRNTNSGGIGSACAKALAAEGCDVVLHYSSSQEKADTLVNELQRLHPKQLFSTARADLSSREATRLLVPDVLSNPAISVRHKAISILVANAGTGRRIRDIKDIEEDDWDLTLEINARSQFVVTKACLPGMRGQGWGRVILVGSIASRGGGINGCHYAASKGAMTSMGLNLATILAPEGVTVNIVQPAMIGATGMIPTPKATTWQSNTDPEELRSTDPGLAIASSVPVHRLGAPEEVANIVVL
ncbi:NAD(P)-binding domain protein, partial [Metarhizium brunneum ARSEF 3297]